MLKCVNLEVIKIFQVPVKSEIFSAPLSKSTLVPKDLFRPIMLFLVAAESYEGTNINQPPDCRITVVDRSAVVLNLFLYLY